MEQTSLAPRERDETGGKIRFCVHPPRCNAPKRRLSHVSVHAPKSIGAFFLCNCGNLLKYANGKAGRKEISFNRILQRRAGLLSRRYGGAKLYFRRVAENSRKIRLP